MDHAGRISIVRFFSEMTPDPHGMDPFVVDAAKEFLAGSWCEEATKQWLHELRDYCVRYSLCAPLYISGIGAVLDTAERLYPPPPEGDDTAAWRKRWFPQG